MTPAAWVSAAEKAMQDIAAALDAYINGERRELLALMDISRIVGRYEMERIGGRQVIPVAAQNAAFLVLASKYPYSGLVYSEQFSRALDEALEAASAHMLREAKECAYDEGYEDGDKYNKNPYRSQI